MFPQYRRLIVRNDIFRMPDDTQIIMTTITHTFPFTPIPVSPSHSNSRSSFPTLPQSQWPLFHLFIIKTRRLYMKPMSRPRPCPRCPRRYLTPITPFYPSPPTTTTAPPYRGQVV